MDTAVFCLWIILVCFTALGDGRCKFPRDWKGRWYQGGLGEVVIRSNSIATKGTCVNHADEEFFLVENREDNCFRCLLIIKRHKNILQYKESFCLKEGTLATICPQIQVETPLYTLVREPHQPSPCPIDDAFYFNYDDSTGMCDKPLSYAKPCAGNTKYNFHFQHCKPWALMNGDDIDFDCVATWKDGSDLYLYAKFSGPSIVFKEQSYRCFKYEAYGTQVYMSMSADTNCRGLYSARDGTLILEFTKDVYGWSQSACDFPDWMTSHNVWRDLDSRYLFEIDQKRGGTLAVSFRKRPETREHIKYELRCLDIKEFNSSNHVTMVSFSSHQCVSDHQCVTISRVAPGFLQVRLGALSSSATSASCWSETKYDESFLLIPEDTSSGIACPFNGRYPVLYGSSNCNHDLQAGCQYGNQIDLNCDADVKAIPYLKCLATWKTSHTTNVIVENAVVEGGPAGCVSFKETDDKLLFDTSCENMPSIFLNRLTLTLGKSPEKCDPDSVLSRLPFTTSTTSSTTESTTPSTTTTPTTTPTTTTTYSDYIFSFPGKKTRRKEKKKDRRKNKDKSNRREHVIPGFEEEDHYEDIDNSVDEVSSDQQTVPEMGYPDDNEGSYNHIEQSSHWKPLSSTPGLHNASILIVISSLALLLYLPSAMHR